MPFTDHEDAQDGDWRPVVRAEPSNSHVLDRIGSGNVRQGVGRGRGKGRPSSSSSTTRSSLKLSDFAAGQSSCTSIRRTTRRVARSSVRLSRRLCRVRAARRVILAREPRRRGICSTLQEQSSPFHSRSSRIPTIPTGRRTNLAGEEHVRQEEHGDRPLDLRHRRRGIVVKAMCTA